MYDQSVNGELMHIYQVCDGAQILRFNSHSFVRYIR